MQKDSQNAAGGKYADLQLTMPALTMTRP